jgi:hypothetical protein
MLNNPDLLTYLSSTFRAGKEAIKNRAGSSPGTPGVVTSNDGEKYARVPDQQAGSTYTHARASWDREKQLMGSTASADRMICRQHLLCLS